MSEHLVDDPIRMEFEQCDAHTVADIAVAVVDQVAAGVDADIAVLDAVGDVLADALISAHRIGVVSLEVSVRERELRVDVTLAGDVDSARAAFGEVNEDVDTFFDVAVERSNRIRLAGSLG